jgi:hypothetical protein
VSEAPATMTPGETTTAGAPTPADLGFALDDPAFIADPYPVV